MRVAGIASGHRWREKLLLAAMRVLSGRPPPDVVKTLLYRRDFWGDPYNEVLPEIMRLIDGPIALLPCVSQNFYRRCDDCPDERACELRGVMGRVRRETSDILDRTSLADALVRPPVGV